MTIPLREELQESLGLSEAQLNRLILRAPHTYKVYTIPKRTGGVRVIAQPAQETKLIQNWLIKRVFSELPVHDCATAYQVGSSIKKNADAHREHQYLAKFDFQNFFTSIKFDDLLIHMSCHLPGMLSGSAIRDAARISCIQTKQAGNLCLSIGAPSSPLLSNSVMFEFDSMVSTWCEGQGVIYTRYADDMTFSTNRKGCSREIEGFIRDVAGKLDYPKLRFNSKKTVFLSAKYQRRITGIIINNDGELSLGRDRKREIKALVHKFTCDELPVEEIYRLQGLLGFAVDVEPTFVKTLNEKYSEQTIEAILSIRKE